MLGESETKPFRKEMIIQDINKAFHRVKEIVENRDQLSHLPLKFIFHDSLQQELVDLAQDYGMIGYPEFGIDNYEQGKSGFIDVAWMGIDGTKLLMEIDSSFRQKSVQKLLKANVPMKIWVYYGAKPINILLEREIQNHITIIHIPTSFPKTKQTMIQQSLF